jgi:hypothetical protein
MDQSEVQYYVNERRGVWRKPSAEETEERLVNKRIKVWWEGNQRFFEADVLSYNFEEKTYQVVYLIDNNAQDEKLDASAKWEILDETQEELRLRKRRSSQVKIWVCCFGAVRQRDVSRHGVALTRLLQAGSAG